MLLYAAGKMDWLAYGLPREGKLATTPNVGELAHRDVPTCGPDERVGDVRERVRAAAADVCAVVNDRGVVLGLLRQQELEAPADTVVEAAMQCGPSTFRPSAFPEEIAKWLRRHDLDSALITKANGVLVGLLRLADIG